VQRRPDTGEFTASRGDHPSATSNKAFSDRRSETSGGADDQRAGASD